MDNYQTRRLSLFQRVIEFFVGLALENPPAALGKLKQVVGNMQQLSTNQSIGKETSRMRVKGKEAARVNLVRDHLTPLRSAALSLKGEIPDLARWGTVPGRNISQTKLVNIAEAAKELASQHAAKLIAAGLPETFIADLEAAIKDVEQSGRKRVKAGDITLRATKKLPHVKEEGNNLLRSLNAWVLSHLKHDFGLIDYWKRVRRGEANAVTNPVTATQPQPGSETPPASGSQESKAA